MVVDVQVGVVAGTLLALSPIDAITAPMPQHRTTGSPTPKRSTLTDRLGRRRVGRFGGPA
jgi:hypothetical protein